MKLKQLIVFQQTCQLTREDKFSTMRRFSVLTGGAFLFAKKQQRLLLAIKIMRLVLPKAEPITSISKPSLVRQVN